nr:hypothetical protein [uncultured Lichenicoccus sp.]
MPLPTNRPGTFADLYASNDRWPLFHPDDVQPLPTIRITHESGHNVLVRCNRCDRATPLDLPSLIAAGRGEVALVELPMRCSCGSWERTITVMAGRASHDPRQAGR